MAGPSHDPALYRPRDVVAVRRALVSVSDKTDLLALGEALAAAGVEIVSTGGSATLLREAGYASRRSTPGFTRASWPTSGSRITSVSSPSSTSSRSSSWW